MESPSFQRTCFPPTANSACRNTYFEDASSFPHRSDHPDQFLFPSRGNCVRFGCRFSGGAGRRAPTCSRVLPSTYSQCTSKRATVLAGRRLLASGPMPNNLGVPPPFGNVFRLVRLAAEREHIRRVREISVPSSNPYLVAVLPPRVDWVSHRCVHLANPVIQSSDLAATGRFPPIPSLYRRPH